jgi:hypothetical protein
LFQSKVWLRNKPMTIPQWQFVWFIVQRLDIKSRCWFILNEEAKGRLDYMAQPVSRLPLTTEVRVRPCGICGGQSGTGTGFSPSSSVPLVGGSSSETVLPHWQEQQKQLVPLLCLVCLHKCGRFQEPQRKVPDQRSRGFKGFAAVLVKQPVHTGQHSPRLSATRTQASWWLPWIISTWSRVVKYFMTAYWPKNNLC